MTRFDAFWEVVCAQRQYLWVGFMVMVFMFILNAIPLVLLPRGTASHAISVVNLILILAGSLLIGGTYYACLRRRTQRY